MSEGGAKISVTAAAASQNLGMRAKRAKKTVAARRNSESDVSKALPATGAKGIENLKARAEKAKGTVAAASAISDVSAETPTAESKALPATGAKGIENLKARAEKAKNVVAAATSGAPEIEKAVAGETGLDTQAADTMTDVAKLEFPPELTGWSRVNVPPTDFDCLVHSMLIAVSPTFRKQPLAVRNTIASKFRRDGLFSKTEGLTDEEAKRIAANQTYLQTPELEKFAKQHGLNFLIVAKTSGAVQAGILKTKEKLPGQKEASVLEGKAGAPVYVIYNENQNHFEAVHGPSGEYSMPYDEAIKIAKNFHKDEPKPSEAPPPMALDSAPAPAPAQAPAVDGPPPKTDDFGFIKLTDSVDPPDVIVHNFKLNRDGDTLKPSMQLMGSDPATPKIESLKTETRERTRAEKKVLKRGDGTIVPADSVILGAYTDMEIPLFHFATDVEKFLDDPNVVSSTSQSILPPASPLLKGFVVDSTGAITFNLKSPISEITFSPTSAQFNNFSVGPVGNKDHRAALHGFLVTPVTVTIKGRGPVQLKSGFEMVSILTGTLGTAPPGGPEVKPTVPTTPLLEAAAPPTATAAPPTATAAPPTATAATPTAAATAAATSAAAAVTDLPPSDKNKQLVQDISQQASDLIRMEAARDKAEADIAAAGDVSPQRRLQLINEAQQLKKLAAEAKKKWEATGKKVVAAAEKEHERVKKAHAEYMATLKEMKDAAKAANDKLAKLEKEAAAAKNVLDKEVAKGDKSTNKRKEALAKTSVQIAKDIVKAKADVTEADADAALWSKDEQTVEDGLANSAANLEDVRKAAKDPRYVSPKTATAAPGAVSAMAGQAAAPANAVQTPVNTALQHQEASRRLVATNPMRDTPAPAPAPDPAPAPAPPADVSNPMRDAPAAPLRLVNPLAPTPEGLAARAAAEERLGLGERGTLGSPITPQLNTPLTQGEVAPPVAPSIAPEVAASLDAFNPNAAPAPAPAAAPAPAPATTGTSVPAPTVSIDSGVMTSLDQFAPRRPRYTAPVTEPATPPLTPTPTNITGTIDENFDKTFREAVIQFMKSVDSDLNLKLINDENVDEAFKDKRLSSYITDVKKNHRGQTFTLQFPDREFLKSSAAKGTGWNAGGGDWEIPAERKMGGDTVFISIDKFKYGSTLVKEKKTGGARPTGPTFRFEFELNYPQEKVGGRQRSLKRRRNPAARKTMRR